MTTSFRLNHGSVCGGLYYDWCVVHIVNISAIDNDEDTRKLKKAWVRIKERKEGSRYNN